MAKFEVPEGFMVRGFMFEVKPGCIEQDWLANSHFGARRYAFNWVIALAKDNINKRSEARSIGIPETLVVPSLDWSLAALRKLWNVAKKELAPWWDANSKEAYSSGIADAVTALQNWSKSKNGKRKGRRVGFPKFKSRRKDRARVRFTTGAMRVENTYDIILPVLGKITSKESTRRLRRVLKKTGSRILSMTLSRSTTGRLHVSISALVPKLKPTEVTEPDTSVGVDPGIGKDNWLRVVDTEGVVRHNISAPTHWSEYAADIRRYSRQMSRRTPGSRGWHEANNARNKVYEKQKNVREHALHQIVNTLTSTYGRIVLEGTDWAAMAKSLFRKDRRAVAQAGLGRLKVLLSYKAESTTTELVIADKWFPSSKTCSNLKCGRINRWLKRQKFWTCEECGTHHVDRDDVSGANLARYDELEWQKFKKEQGKKRRLAAKRCLNWAS